MHKRMWLLYLPITCSPLSSLLVPFMQKLKKTFTSSPLPIQLLLTFILLCLHPLLNSPTYVYSLIFVMIGLLGIPHGALDHLLFYTIHSSSTVFYVTYLSILGLWCVGWSVLPNLTFWAFIILSVNLYFTIRLTYKCVHFGEAELDYTTSSKGVYFSRGVYIIGNIAFSDYEITKPIIASLIGFNSFLEKYKFVYLWQV
jgi:hypothetical protein